MNADVVTIDAERMECADCAATLCDVVLPRMPGVLKAETIGGSLLVTLDPAVLTEAQLIERLTESGLLK